ncbi:MAG: hypothetical protein JW751_13750 [Polyangiaceae bacterium]|nr:hypothetical protein [Polyangiaceae bacterium]
MRSRAAHGWTGAACATLRLAEPLPAWGISGRAADVFSTTWLRLLLAMIALGAVAVPRPVAAEEAAKRVLVVQVDPGSSGVDPEAVRAAIARELGVDVVDAPTPTAAGTLRTRLDDEERVWMVFESPDGWRSVERSVRVPSDPERRVEAVALLAGNLARDEAGELVVALRAAEAARRQAEELTAAKEAAAAKAEAAQVAAAKAEAARAEALAAVASAASGNERVLLGAPKPRPRSPGERGARIADEVHHAIDAAEAASPPLEPAVFQAAFLLPFAIYPDATRYRFLFVTNAIHGRQGGVEGLAVAGLTQITTGPTHGVSAATIWQETGTVTAGFAGAGIGQVGRGSLRGFEGSGVINVRDGVVEGGQGAGIGNLASGVVGLQLAGIFNRVRGDLLGVQLAAVNIVDGEAVGGQIGYLVNVAREPATGLMFAGLVNMARDAGAEADAAPGTARAPVRPDPVEGVRIAGIANVSAAPFRGAAIAGVFNRLGSIRGGAVAGLFNLTGSVDYAAVAGLFNVTQSVEGAVVSGLFNRAGDVRGAEIAPIVNVARDVHGLQLGLVNVARDVSGTQVGLVNVSRKNEGMPIGLVNIAKGGPRVVAWHEHAIEGHPSNLVGGLDLAGKFLVGPLYTQFGLGGDPIATTWDATAGVGVHLPLRPVFFEIDALWRGDWDVRASNEHDAQAIHYRGKIGVDVLKKRVSLFAGGGLRQVFAGPGAAPFVNYDYVPTAFAGLEVR